MRPRANTLPYLIEKYRDDVTQYTFQGVPIDRLSAHELRAILAYKIDVNLGLKKPLTYREERALLSKDWGTA